MLVHSKALSGYSERTYHEIQTRREADLSLFPKVLLRLNCSNYTGSLEVIPASSGLRPSSLSRRSNSVTKDLLVTFQTTRYGCLTREASLK
jgi:hypothetical protein